MAGFPTLAEFFNSLAFLGEGPAAIGVLVTASLLIILRDWRWSLLALAAQFLLAGWLLTQVFEPEIAPAIAAIKIMVGMVICLVFYFTARQVRWGDSKAEEETSPDDSSRLRIGRWVLPTSLLFRTLICLMAAIVILYTTSNGNLVLPGLPSHINQAAVSLMGMGLLALGLTDEPLTAGMGLLTLMTGMELFYHSLEQAITVIGFLLGIDFMVALIAAYLTVARHWTPKEAGRRHLT